MLANNFKLELAVDKFKYVSLWVMLLSSLIGCQAPLISIQEISEKKIGQSVYLKGKVVRLAPFVDHAAYQIEDTTGKIWVVTPKSSPKIGQQINIKGKIEYQSLPFEQQELGDFYIVELKQLDSIK